MMGMMKMKDAEIMRIDRAERLAKRNKAYQQKETDDLIRCLNAINDNLGLLLVEVRRLCDVLEWSKEGRK